jgi:hypothetical protein
VPKADNAWTLTATDLETGQTVVKDVLTVDALSTIMLRTAIEAMYPGMRFERPFGISHHATSASLRPSRQARPRSHELRQSRFRAARQRDRIVLISARIERFGPVYLFCFSHVPGLSAYAYRDRLKPGGHAEH